jgi:putative peptide zinc metalloprotease protein
LPIADAAILHDRFTKRIRAARRQQVVGALFLRVPLINPDAFLDRTADFVKPLFTRAALFAWVLMMTAGGWILFQRWDDFRHPFHSLLAHETLWFLWVTLIVLKLVHEFGHAYACKILGGRVPEMGVFLIALTPCAYVDASSAWGFPRLRDRVVVSLAGVYFESIIAVLALLVWNGTDHPVLGACAHHVVVLSTAVTLAFNLNPLMRYDGYYVLSDLTGIPNLRQQALRQWQTWLKRVVLGIPSPPTRDPRSLPLRGFLGLYGVASAGYKVTLVLAICTMIAMRFYLPGLLLAALFLLGMVAGTVGRLLTYLWRDPETRGIRPRAVVCGLLVLVLPPIAVTAVPIPGSVVLPGILQTDNDTMVYAQTDGSLEASAITMGSRVESGQPVVRLENDLVRSHLEETRAETELARLIARGSALAGPRDGVTAQLRLARAEERLDQARREFDQLTLVAPVSGLVTRLSDERREGRFVRQGETLATVAAGSWIVRCLATAEEFARVGPQVGQMVRVRIATEGVPELYGTVTHVAGTGSSRVFSPLLARSGGGTIPVAPDSLEAAVPLFEVAVRLPETLPASWPHGTRATVAWDAPRETSAVVLHRRFQQFLNRLRLR